MTSALIGVVRQSAGNSMLGDTVTATSGMEYNKYYGQYTQHLSHLTAYSSPSSHGSESIDTPPADHKRPSSPLTIFPAKKPRTDDDPESKPKPTRGSRACTVCRRLKMKCVGAEQGPPCKRCLASNHECVFEESNRGKRSSKYPSLPLSLAFL